MRDREGGALSDSATPQTYTLAPRAALPIAGRSGSAVAPIPARAVDLYRGDLLTGFYDDWMIPDNERLQKLNSDGGFLAIIKGPDNREQGLFHPRAVAVNTKTGHIMSRISNDLFTISDLRARGIGRILLSFLAKLAVHRGCGRLQWSVMDWNEPAIGFYRSLGAQAMDAWTVYRLDGAELAALADEEHVAAMWAVLTRLEAESVSYRRAYAVSSYTAMSNAGLLSGRYPSEMERSGYFFSAYPDDELMFPELLQQAGIRTLAAHAHFYFEKKAGFHQGFDRYMFPKGGGHPRLGQPPEPQRRFLG